jgi:hypothetical protein
MTFIQFTCHKCKKDNYMQEEIEQTRREMFKGKLVCFHCTLPLLKKENNLIRK